MKLLVNREQIERRKRMALVRREETVLIENTRFVYRQNFSGLEGMYNREGDRSFNVLLPEDLANRMIVEGWNVKKTKSREDGDPEEPFLPVAVGFKGRRPPTIVLISSRGRTDLGEGECGLIDYVDVDYIDVIVRPYDWGPINGQTGRKAYLKTIFVHILEDELMQKYQDVQYADSRPRAIEASPEDIDDIPAGTIIPGKVILGDLERD